MRGQHVWAACVALSVAAVSSFGTAAMAQHAELRDLLTVFQERYGFPGATAAIALPDGEVFNAENGLADVKFNRPMAPHTPMLAASIGKSFVAVTLLSLETEGAQQSDPAKGSLVRALSLLCPHAPQVTDVPV